MKSSVLIPVVLVACLLLLAVIITRIFGVQEEGKSLIEVDLPPAAETAPPLPEPAAESTATGARFESDEIPRELRPATDPGEGTADGNYLVLAGTFRQLINARTRVRDLKQAGFARTTLEYFDRGTFAVALAGRYASYAEATDLVRELRQAGYEAQVLENR